MSKLRQASRTTKACRGYVDVRQRQKSHDLRQGLSGAMAQDNVNGYTGPRGLENDPELSEPIFNVERVQLQFNIAADFVAAQVANNVLILALANGRILRIDLDNPTDIDGM